MEHAKQSKLLERCTTRFEQYGETFAAILLGAPMIATIDRLNVQTMFGSNFKDYGVQPLRRSATLPFLGERWFIWQQSRTLMRPNFTRANVANLPSFEKNLQKFFKLLPEDGSTVDLKPLLCKLFIDTSTEYFFGESMDMLSPEQPVRTQEFLDAFHYGQFGTGRRLQLGKLAFLYRDKKYYDSIKVAHAFADFYVDKAIEYRADRLYSQALRLYPVASIASRKAYKDGVLPRGGGPDGKSPIFVRKGTVIITPLYSLHRLADCFKPDGDKVVPSRWEDPSLRPGAAYIPFGWGIHTCPAQHLAEIEIAYTLARMAQKWKYLECRDEVEEWLEELRV
ncbi:hypothetical protein BOTNAR_0317g00080 [Botryotinia narcissicola]|uniref:Cytochrome P450 n=1 Tax=Botryotinia narcissicola TaxID=278944 RepID=A0A4Z1I6W3_9HELO|nr:hypothetical protein BOTNAR_0317g00080 [Botryotinia narcissicola]